MVRQQLHASKHGWTTPLRNAGAIKAQLPGGADGAAANLFVYKKAPPIPAPGLPQTPNPVRIRRYVSVTSLVFYISTQRWYRRAHRKVRLVRFKPSAATYQVAKRVQARRVT